jgi:two-component system, NtrC family, nitrogen regulation response regulator NtrX
MTRILFVDDETRAHHVMRSVLGNRFELTCCSTGEQALTILERTPAEVVFADVCMPGMDGIELLGRIREQDNAPPVIMITGVPDPDLAARVIKLGAADFISKPYTFDTLSRKIAGAIKEDRSEETKDISGTSRDDSKQDLLGESPAIRTVRRDIRKAAKTDLPVVIHGETGVGKEIVAQHIHQLSYRCDRPFLAINCAAYPDTLFDSEVFGVEKGAFTDAVSRPGMFEQADGGTLFLDEVSELALPVQTKLLRVLENGTVRRLGSTRTFTADSRVIAASHLNLAALVESGGFRQDLFFRLQILRIEVPALRKRTQDIPVLAVHFLEMYRRKYGNPYRRAHSKDQSRVPERFSIEALDRLTEHSWPGNVRELRNVVYRSAAFASDTTIRAGDIRIV